MSARIKKKLFTPVVIQHLYREIVEFKLPQPADEYVDSVHVFHADWQSKLQFVWIRDQKRCRSLSVFGANNTYCEP